MADFGLKRLEEPARTWKSTTKGPPYQCLNIIGSLRRLGIYTRWWVLRRLLLNHHRSFRWGCWVWSREDDDRDNKYYYLRSGCGGGLKDGWYLSIDKGTLFAIDSPSLWIDSTYLEKMALNMNYERKVCFSVKLRKTSYIIQSIGHWWIWESNPKTISL
jgi:hypothetical protein